MKNIILLFILLIGCNKSHVTFIVHVPTNTDKITIAGNHSQLGNWNPEIFSMAGCLSPAFLVDNSEIVKRVKKTEKEKPIKLVILNGTVDLEAELQPAITKMVNVLNDKEFENIIYEIFEDAKHDESAWARQVEIPLLYFFGK